eukprot:8052519-Pyramimonas_sp.AAC.1
MQTVGRAERAAVWQALSLPPSVSLIATDLLSLCEGGRRGTKTMLTPKLHIQISGDIFGAVGDKKRPSFQWIPARMN